MQSEQKNTFKKKDNKQDNEQSSFINHWKERLSHLSFEEQERIAKKYYGGHYPWKG